MCLRKQLQQNGLMNCWSPHTHILFINVTIKWHCVNCTRPFLESVGMIKKYLYYINTFLHHAFTITSRAILAYITVAYCITEEEDFKFNYTFSSTLIIKHLRKHIFTIKDTKLSQASVLVKQ